MDRFAKVERACRINDLIFKEIVNSFNFRTEKDIERYILKRFREEGVGHAYPPIVANNNSIIHAKPRKKRLEKGFLLMDFGAKCDGMCSDMTRTIFLGNANEMEKKLYRLVLECQKKCVRKAKAGASCFDIEMYARKFLGDYRRYYRHWLGHGIGKKVHCKPDFGIYTSDVLKRGNVIAIEPGIYIKRKGKEFGIRVEDTVLVGSKPRVLSRADKRFVEIDGF